MDKKVVCAIPWMHLAFEPSGKVIPCCLTSTFDYFSGDLKTQALPEIWNSKNQRDLRLQMMKGEKPEICKKCYKQEDATGQSGRTHHNKQNEDLIKLIPQITEKNGAVPDMKLRYWDFRFSNLCNFKCRSCGPRYSSSWVPDAKKMGWITEHAEKKVLNIDETTFPSKLDFLEEQVKYVKRIYFAGGEPLMMPEHWKVLEMLDAHKKYDVRIDYNTNISKLDYAGKNVIDYWKKWDTHNGPRINVWPSIDEIGPRAEVIRSGTVWSRVEANLKTLAGLKKHIAIEPSITVGAMNVFRLPEIINHLTELGVIGEHPYQSYANFYLNLLEWPSHFHMHILSNKFRAQIKEKLKKFVSEFNKKWDTDIGPRFDQIFVELDRSHNVKQARLFLEKTNQLDTIRDEWTFKTIPEMEDVRRFYPGIYKRAEMIEIKQAKPAFYLTWVINNICTNKCSYCPPSLHNGKNHHYDWNQAKKFINNLFAKHKSIHCSIAGGEPSVSPFFPELVKMFYNKGHTVGVTTNLAKSIRYWKEVSPYLTYISSSYHPSFEDKEFLKKVLVCARSTKTYVRVMMDTRHWDKAVDMYETCKELKYVTTEPVKILDWNEGDFTGCDYNKEQLEWFEKNSKINGEFKEAIYRKNNIGGHFYYSDGTIDEYGDANELVNKGKNDFRGWSCDIGLKSLFVDYNGSIRKANCRQGDIVGYLQKQDDIVWPKQPEICSIKRCHCSTDVYVDKRKPKYGQ